MLLDTSILVLLVECEVLRVSHPQIKVGRGLQHILGTSVSNICEVARVVVVSRCKEQPCYVSELSLLELTKVFLFKSLVHIEYHNVLESYDNILEAPKEILNRFIRILHEAGLSIEVVAVDKQVLNIVREFLQRLKWDEDVLRKKSFDLLLFAQSVARGVKIFTTDRDFIHIRERALPPSGRDERRDRSSGLRYYEDNYIIYVGYS